MSALIYGLLSALVISLLSLIGLFTLVLQDKVLKNALIYLVSFSAGGLIGGAFFHLLPESLAGAHEPINIFIIVLIGFCLFFILERFLRWHHCHDKECENPAHLGYLNLFGDVLHNFFDGLIIITAYLVNPGLGLVTTLSIVFHEIPQELGDFGVLIYSGFSKSRALLLNFMTALASLLGVIVGYLAISYIENLTYILVPLAAGGFIYIASTDLIPELQKVIKLKHSIFTFIVFILALIIMYLLRSLGV